MEAKEAFEVAKSLNFKDVPEDILKIISESPEFIEEYFRWAKFENIPSILIDKICDNFDLCESFVVLMNGINLPGKIYDTIMDKKEFETIKQWYEKKVEEFELNKLWAGDALETAKFLNFKDVPDDELNAIAEHSHYNIEYCVLNKFKNIPDIIIDGISKDVYSCEEFVMRNGFENIPPKIHEAIIKSRYEEYKQWYLSKLRKLKLEKLLK